MVRDVARSVRDADCIDQVVDGGVVLVNPQRLMMMRNPTRREHNRARNLAATPSHFAAHHKAELI